LVVRFRHKLLFTRAFTIPNEFCRFSAKKLFYMVVVGDRLNMRTRLTAKLNIWLSFLVGFIEALHQIVPPVNFSQ
jgi:hypothetical protein